MRAAIKAFFLGLGVVGLVSVNAIQVNHKHYVGAFIVGTLISVIWVSGVNHVVKAALSTKISYCIGAGIGSTLGIVVSNIVY